MAVQAELANLELCMQLYKLQCVPGRGISDVKFLCQFLLRQRLKALLYEMSG